MQVETTSQPTPPVSEAPGTTAAPPAATPPTPPPATPVDAAVDDPIFKAEEPYKGLPPKKDVIATLPPDAKRLLHNADLGARQAATEANALRAQLEEVKAKLGQTAPAPTHNLPLGEGDTRVALSRLYGLEDGDPFEKMPIEGDIDIPDTAFNDDVLADPTKFRGALKDILSGVYKQGIAKARQDYAAIARLSAQPVLAQSQQAAAEQAQQAAAKATTDWRASHPGMDDDAAFMGAYEVAVELFPDRKVEGKWPAINEAQREAVYAEWARRTGYSPAQPAAVAQPEPVATPSATPPPKVDPIAFLRGKAQDAVGGGGHGSEGAIPVMPESIRNGPSLAKDRWIAAQSAANPIVARAFRESTEEAEAIRRKVLFGR